MQPLSQSLQGLHSNRLSSCLTQPGRSFFCREKTLGELFENDTGIQGLNRRVAHLAVTGQLYSD